MTVILDKTVKFLQGEKDKLVVKSENTSREIDRLETLRSVIIKQIDEINLLMEVLDVKPEPEPELYTVKQELAVKSGTGSRMIEIAEENRKKILSTVEKHGWATVNFISKEIKVSPSSVQKHVLDMVEDGRLTRKLEVKPNGGRAPYVYKLVPAVDKREHRVDLITRIVE